MVKKCCEKGSPKPTFTENSGRFVVTIELDIFKKGFLSALSLDDHQMKAIKLVKEKGRITNTGYQKLVETTKKTATRDLQDLVDKEIMEQVGTTGRGTYYVLRKYASKANHKIEKSKGDLKGT